MKPVALCVLACMVCWTGHSIVPTIAKDVTVDLSASGCDNLASYDVGDADTVSLYYPYRPNAIPTRSDCDVSVRTGSGKRLHYIIDTINFRECGIDITIYDSPGGNIVPKNIINCDDNNKAPIEGITNYNVLNLNVRKSDVGTDNFEFRMLVFNNRGPPPDYRRAEINDLGNSLDPGVIAGIGIAGGIIIIALVLLAIYLCVRARQASARENQHQEANVFTSGNSQVFFANSGRYPQKKYGSTEDIRSTSSSQDKANGAFSNPAYTTDPGEKRSQRSSSIGRKQGKTGFADQPYDQYDTRRYEKDGSWENEEADVRIGSFRMSRKDGYEMKEKTQLKSAMKKRDPPSEIEMSKVNTQPINGILKTRHRSPNRSQTSSTEGSVDKNAMVYGYKHTNAEHPNIKHKPVIERRRSRSKTRSNQSGSSSGRVSSRTRSASGDRKKPKPNSRMYGDVFIEDNRGRSGSRSRRPRSSSGRRSNSDRTGSESLDSESSATSYSKRVSMNPGGKRVHIKGEETDI